MFGNFFVDHPGLIGYIRSMTTQVDVYLKFPSDAWDEVQYNKLRQACGSVEQIERGFEIEFSCGDGKYIEDFYQWSDNEQAIRTTVTDEELEKYDGNVSLDFPPRFVATKEPLKTNKPYRFTIKYSEKTEEVVYYINGKEISREWVG